MWAKSKADFNHDWLKNFFIMRLSEFLQLLDRRTQDTNLEATFVSTTLREWEVERYKAWELITSFEQEMSPRRFFEVDPLSRCDLLTKSWLPALIHSLWVKRCKVPELVDQATAAYRKADAAYDALTRALSTCIDTRSANALRDYRKEFGHFREECEGLTDALSLFPRETKLV